MSARDFIDAVIWGHTGLSDERNEVIAGRLEAALMDMPLPDRLDLARALVPDDPDLAALRAERDKWRAWLFDVVSGICTDEHDGATLARVAHLLEPKGSEIARAILNDAEVERIARAALEPST